MATVFGIYQSRFLRMLVAIAIICATALAAGAAHQAIIYQRNLAQLDEMSRQLLRSSELAIDYALISLGDLLAQSNDPCSADGLELIQQAVFARGSIKDIEAIGDGGVLLCSGMSGRTGGLVDQNYMATYHPALNTSVMLQATSAQPTGIFKVAWKLSDAFSLVALLNVDTLMFDVFPADLREESGAELVLGSIDVVAAHVPEAGGSSQDLQVFSTMSDRFPISATLLVPSSKLFSWNADSWPVAIVLGALLGCLLAFLTLKAMNRPMDPTRELRDAIRNKELQPYFQPIFSLRTGQTVGCEVLTRWLRADGSMVSPDRFIPLAEASGLIVPLTDHIVAASLTRLAVVLSSRPDFKIAFNVTPAHFMANDFLDTLCSAVDAAKVERGHIVIELTERQALVDAQEAAAQCRRAQELGFRVSLDDTGSGHNGLSQVQELPLDIIKIDKKFVDLVCTDRAAITIIEMLVRLAKALGASTVAEGVETIEQYHALRDCGVDEGQGYLVSSALPADRFIAFVDQPVAAQLAA